MRMPYVERLESRRLLTSVSFTSHVLNTQLGSPGLAWGDRDSDAASDVLYLVPAEREISWREVGLDGKFHDRGVAILNVDEFVTGDLDGDGDADILASSVADEELSIYWNDSVRSSPAVEESGHTDRVSRVNVNGDVTGFALVDLDADGILDVVVESMVGFSRSLSWRSSKGSEMTTIGSGRGLRLKAAGDLDADGAADLLGMSDSNELVWLRNSGDGVLFQRQAMVLDEYRFDPDAPIELTDIDKDGHVDVVAVTFHEYARTIAWYGSEPCLAECDSLRQWHRGGVVSANRPFISSIEVGDFDGDGDSDVLFAQLDRRQVNWVENESGSFANEYLMASLTVDGPVSLQVQDVDGDGDSDVLMAHQDRIGWLENNDSSRRSFWRWHTVDGSTSDVRGFVASVLAEDIDSDGDIDVFASSRSGIGVYENDGKAKFVQRQYLHANAGDQLQEIELSDYDGDGDPDLLARVTLTNSPNTPGNVVIFLNDGSGTFGPMQTIATDALCFVAGDLNADDLADIAVFRRDSMAIDYANGTSLTLEFRASCSGQELVDFDGDGDIDIFLGYPSNGFQWIERLDNEAEFVERVFSAQDTDRDVYVRSWAIGDIDIDGLTDMVVLGSTVEGGFDSRFPDGTGAGHHGFLVPEDFVYFGVGGTPIERQFGGAHDSVTAIADLDGDGDGDLVMDGAWYYEYIGDLRFAAPVPISDGGSTATTGDVDGDGDLDLISLDVHGRVVWLESNMASPSTGSGSNEMEASGVIRINSGGDAFVDVLGNAWEADTNFLRGFAYTSETWEGRQPLLRSERAGGDFAYEITVPNGVYEVDLHFAEVYHRHAGARVFDVVVEDTLVIDDLDIISDVGQRFRPTTMTVHSVVVSDGVLNLRFTAEVDNANVSGLEVRTASAIAEPIPDSQPELVEPSDFGSIAPMGATDTHYGTVVEDIDGDGDLDVVVTINNELLVYENDGKANYTRHVLSTAEYDWGPVHYENPVVADVNGDGNQDIVVERWRQLASIASLHWFQNDGSGNYLPQGGIAAGRDFALGDVDGDSDLDVASFTPPSAATTNSFYSPGVEVRVNTGDGFVTHTRHPGFEESPLLALVDLDGDGDLDLLGDKNGGYFNNTTIGWLENRDGRGSFDISHRIERGPRYLSSIEVGDFDGDGTQDLMMLGFDEPWEQPSKRYYLFQNAEGQGTFHVREEVVIALPNTGHERVSRSIDVDGVGDLDLLQGNCLFSNLGDGIFEDAVQFASGSTIDALGDIDGDGDLDVVTSDGSLAWREAYTSSQHANAIRINAGGGDFVDDDCQTWHEDAHFTRSFTTPTTAPRFSNTDRDGLFNTTRYADSFSYEIPVSNGTYDVGIHFAEIHFKQVGDRVFDVFAEGTSAAAGLDLIAEAGEPFQATTVVLPLVEVADGALNLDFIGQVNNATVSAIEVLPQQPVEQEIEELDVVRINAGGQGFVDASGNTWKADANFTRGFTFSTENEIANTENDVLFQTERFGGAFGYEVPVENGSYEVEIYLAEIFFQNVGERVFDISLEGDLVIEALDLIGETGARNKAMSIVLPSVQVADGILNLDFTAQINNGKISAFEIRPAAIVHSPILGDADGDGAVAFSDFLILAGNFGGEGSFEEGDFDGDGTIGFSDFLVLAANFGSTT